MTPAERLEKRRRRAARKARKRQRRQQARRTQTLEWLSDRPRFSGADFIYAPGAGSPWRMVS